ncbi:MAG: hypothetical protein RL630_871 [Verrucomicrobiota bacterium]|jgi:endoglucanase
MIKKILQLAFVIVAHAAMASESSVPPFEKGDLVAFAGDSITSGGGYHKYILTYWTTRHPELGVRFRNKGIFSDFAHGGIARLDTDILKEKPNKIVINFGMNDSGASYRPDLFGKDQPDETVLQKRREAVATYRANMEKLLGMLKERGITPVLVGPSIYDNTMKSEAVNHHDANTGIQACIEELKDLKTQNGLGFVDFNAPMLEVNARMQAQNPAFGIAGKDRVHPMTEGHWVMAYEFLKAQNASPVVATLKIDAAKPTVLESANCAVDALQAGEGRVSFDYLPRSLPLPVNDEYRAGEKVLPLTELLNREILAVQGLKPGRYNLLLDGQNAGEFSAEALAAGINIGTLEANPGQRRAKEVDALIQERAKTEGRIRQLRQMDAGEIGKKPREEIEARISQLLEESTQKNNKAMIKRCTTYLADFPQESALDQTILDLEAKIASTAQPQPIKVSIEPAPPQQPASITPVPRTENEEKWVSRHQERVATAKKGDIDVILIGDSITDYGQRVPLYKHYFRDRKVLNMGQGGDRTQNVLWRLQNGEVEGLQPKIAFLMIGTNNIGRGESPEDTVLGIQTVLAELHKRLPNTKVVLFSIFPRTGEIMKSVDKVNVQLPGLADGQRVVHVDLGHVFRNPDGTLIESRFGRDKLHLNNEGYRVWWENMEPLLSAALGVPALPPGP